MFSRPIDFRPFSDYSVRKRTKGGRDIKDNESKQLTEFIQTYKEIDGLCHNYAKTHGLSDTVFYVLYALVDRGSAYPQRELCEDWSYPPQTVNSALKTLETQGVVELIFSPGNRKNKEIHLTDKGRMLAKEIIEPFMEAERSAFFGVEEEYRRIWIFSVQQYIAHLNDAVKTIPKQGSQNP